MQPVSAYLLVKLRISVYVPTLVTCWGLTLLCMAAAHNFIGLLSARFVVGTLSDMEIQMADLFNVSWVHLRLLYKARLSSLYKFGIEDKNKVFASPVGFLL